MARFIRLSVTVHLALVLAALIPPASVHAVGQPAPGAGEAAAPPSPSPSPSPSPMAERSPRLLVHLLDYLARDYGGAVSEDGRVLSRLEYDEQIEFAKEASEANKTLSQTGSAPELQGELEDLYQGILAKAPPADVSALARKIQARIIEVSGLENFPQEWPSLADGQRLYSQSCVSCHGEKGAGDGPAGKGLDPAPADFTDSARMYEVAPFNAFNTIRLGVSGTGMPAFPDLSDREAWALAFYVVSIRHGGGPGAGAKAENNHEGGALASLSGSGAQALKMAASLSDKALANTLSGDEVEKKKVLSALRTHTPAMARDNDYLRLAKRKLFEANVAYAAGQVASAKASALEAYLEGIEPVEPRIRASDADALVRIEEVMSRVRSSIEGGRPLPEVKASIDAALLGVDEIERLISEKEMSPWVSFAGAFAIILREGFEAVLVVLALLAAARAAGSAAAARWVHSGWLAAVAVGGAAWVFSGWVLRLSGSGRELLEGAISAIAVVVLLYVGFWMHRQTEIGRWKNFLEVKVKGMLGARNLFGLASISFLAVFREALETVLFLRVLWVESGTPARTALGMGVLSSFVLVMGLSWLALKFSRRLPLSELFRVSSITMLGLATVLGGKALHALQEAGVVGVTVFPLQIRWELAGVYPTMETVAAQALIFALALWLWAQGRVPAAAQKVRA